VMNKNTKQIENLIFRARKALKNILGEEYIANYEK